MITNIDPLGDYPLMHTAIINPNRKVGNVNYLVKKWKFNGVPDEYRNRLAGEVLNYVNKLSKINEYKEFNYYMWGKIFIGLENHLNDVIKFWRVCDILDA